MTAGREAWRAQTVGLPGFGAVCGDDERAGAEAVDFDEEAIGGEAGFGGFEITAEVFVFERVKAGDLGAVVDDGIQVRSGCGAIGPGPAAAADHGSALVGDVHELRGGEAGGTAEGEERFGRRSAPIIDLAAEFGALIELGDGGDGARFRSNHVRFDQREIG